MSLVEKEFFLVKSLLESDELMSYGKSLCFEQKFSTPNRISLTFKDDLLNEQIDFPPKIIFSVMNLFSDVFENHLLYNLQQWDTVTINLNLDGNYQSRYWNDTENILIDTLRVSKDFTHALANHLVNHYLLTTVKFKTKFARIIWTLWVENNKANSVLYLVNKKNQKVSIELEESYNESNKNDLLNHYEVTNNGILKDVWQPWNKIIISIPPDGYLNENEDIEYYLNEVKLEKTFFLRGY
jgi:hypothetical protein